ncbi:hypothetical protein J132_03884, partial [Termitomyces sp. J132]
GLGPGFKTHVWVPSGVKKEWGKLGGCVNMVVVLEFSIGEEFVPVILTLIAEEVEILFQLLVYVLHLTVGLWVVGSGGVELYSKQSVELPSELCHKLWSPIQDIGIREAMELPNVPLVQVYSTYGGAGGVDQNEVHSLAIQVHHHHDHIITVGVRELYNEVYKCYAPPFHGHW